jgi:hypothetical protein
MGDSTSPTPASPSRGDARLQPIAADLTAEDVREFADLWEREYGVRLSDDEAKERAEKLVRFVLLMQRMGS